MKTLWKLLCLALVLVGLCNLWSCSEPVKDHNVEIEVNHEKNQLTLIMEYSEKFKECLTNVVGLQTTKLVSENTEALENGHTRKTVTYALSSSKMTVVMVNFKGVNEKDNTSEFYRAEVVNGYVVVRTLEGLQTA